MVIQRSCALDPKLALTTNQTFFLMFRAKPKEPPRDLGAPAGAYINCWIKCSDEQQAEKQARQTISSNNWVAEILEEKYPICRDDYDDDPSGIEYYDQAQIDGEVYVYHVWAMGPEVLE